jgi:hypothetical protein
MEIFEELTVHPVEKKLAQYKNKKWLNQLRRMENVRYPKQLLDYRPIGRLRPGRPLKRLQDRCSSEAGTGQSLA